MMFNKNSAFGQQQEIAERYAAESVEPPTPSSHEEKAPFEHWHHDLVTIDVLLDQDPPEVERARSLLLEVADEIHSEFETVGGKRR